MLDLSIDSLNKSGGSAFHPIERVDTYGLCDVKRVTSGCNCSNNQRISNIDVLKQDRDNIQALEENIQFLRKEHDIMLSKLHDEIDSLRRINKDLQFKLVMCCCVKQSSNVDKPCVRSVENVNIELDEMRELLLRERTKNQILSKKLEVLQETGQIVIDGSDTGKPLERCSPKVMEDEAVQLSPEENSTQGMNLGASPENIRPEISVGTGGYRTSVSAQPKPPLKKRIASPEMNQDSQSSALLLTPTTNMPTPDGFWVRPSVAGLKNNTIPRETRQSLVSNKHILPVKLPIAHEPDTTIGSGPKELLTARLSARDLVPDKNSSSFIKDHRLEKQIRIFGSTSSVRSTLGHDSIASYDFSALRLPKSRSIRPTNNFASTSFLPDLPKSAGSDRSLDPPRRRRRSTRINTHNPLTDD